MFLAESKLIYETLYSLCEKCSYPGFFWSVFSRIQTEYGEIPSISRSVHSCGKIRTRKYPNTDTFHAVTSMLIVWIGLPIMI